MTKILLIRHALTDGVGKRLSGCTSGVYLNETGRKQARELAESLSEIPISAIYCSPLERAVETAEPIACLHKLQYITSNNFMEIDFGEWTNLAIEDLVQDSQFQLFNDFRSNIRIPRGETMLEAQFRAIKGLQELTNQHQNQTIAIVSHGDIIKSIIAYYAGISLDFMRRLEISPASVSILEIFNETVRVLQLNYTGKLYFDLT